MQCKDCKYLQYIEYKELLTILMCKCQKTVVMANDSKCKYFKPIVTGGF